MIGISTLLFDIDGDFIFYNTQMRTSDLSAMNIAKRVTKIATLDSDVFIDDSGYVAGDNDVKITLLETDADLVEKLRNIFIYHSFVIITTSYGSFLCVPYTLRLNGGGLTMVFSTKSTA